MKTKYPKITLSEKVFYMEKFLHQLCLVYQVGNTAKIQEMLSNVEMWSYAHRCGNGALTSAEQEQLIRAAFWNNIVNI